MSDGRMDQGPGREFEATGKERVSQRVKSRTKLANQSWGDFFRGMAIEIAIVAVLVGAFATYVWWINR